MSPPRSLCVTLLLLLLPLGAWARSTIRTSVDRETIDASEMVRLTVQVESDGTDGAGRLENPDLSQDWEVVQRSQQSINVNGEVRNTQTLMLRPLRAGALRIDSFRLRLDNGTVQSSAPLRVQVEGQAGAPGGQVGSTPDPGGTGAVAEALDSTAFLTWELDRAEPWLGEQVGATLYLYFRRGFYPDDISLGDINLEGFWTEQVNRNNRRSPGEVVQLGGQLFQREEVARYQLFPIRAGELKLPPVKVEMFLSERLAFGGGRRQRLRREAPVVTLSVKALPAAGRPADFAGPAVGRVQLSLLTDRRQIRADEGIQVTLETVVDGLISNVPEVALPELADWKVFPPTTDVRSSMRGESLSGTRRTKWLLRPLKTGNLTIPAVQLSYFDPAAGAYKTAVTQPVRVTVKEGGQLTAPDAPSAAPGRAAVPAGPSAAVVEQPLRGIRPEVTLAPEPPPAWSSVPFLGLVAGAPLLLLGVWLRDVLRARRGIAAPAERVRRAAGEARKALERLRAQPAEGQSFAALARTLVTYMETRFGEPFNGLTHDRLSARLRDRGVPEAVARAVVSELENADFARFAPAGGRAAELSEAVGRTLELVNRLEEVG